MILLSAGIINRWNHLKYPSSHPGKQNRPSRCHWRRCFAENAWPSWTHNWQSNECTTEWLSCVILSCLSSEERFGMCVKMWILDVFLFPFRAKCHWRSWIWGQWRFSCAACWRDRDTARVSAGSPSISINYHVDQSVFLITLIGLTVLTLHTRLPDI